MRTFLLLLALSLMLMQPARAQHTVNLSKDLIAFGIAEQNLAPNRPDLDAQPLLNAAIQYAQSNGVEVLTADTGSYYFLTPQNAVLYVFLGEISNLTIDFQGSHLYFKDGMLRAFEADYCKHVTLKNFTIDQLQPRYTQVRVTSVDPVKGTFTYTVPRGWADPASFTATATFGTPQLFALFFRDGASIPRTGLTFISYPVLSPNLVILSNGEPWTQPDVLRTVRRGDMAAVWDRSGLESISVDSGDFITLLNIEVHGSGGGFAVAVGRSSNSVAENVRVKPRAGGLIGSNADGIHFSFSIKNNHIRHCYVTGTTDDALALDSDFVASVVRKPSPRQLVATRNFANRVANGTRVNFVRLSDGAEVRAGVVTDQSPVDSMNVGSGGQMTLTFDRDLPELAPGDELVYADAEMRGAGSTVEDNWVENIPNGRGLYLGGIEDVIIQRNVISGTSNAGINISEVTVPVGGGGLPSHGVVIQSNSIERVLGPKASGAGGAIVNQAAIVVSSNDPNFNFVSIPVNSAISIRNNFVADSGRGGIWMSEVNRGEVRDNFVTRWNLYPDLPVWGAAPFPADLSEPYAEHFDRGVAVAGNVFAREARIAAPVSLYPSGATLDAGVSAGWFTVDGHLPEFGWSAISDSSWLYPVLESFGGVGYTVEANRSGLARSGRMAVGGAIFTVRQSAQDGPPCAGSPEWCSL